MARQHVTKLFFKVKVFISFFLLLLLRKQGKLCHMAANPPTSFSIRSITERMHFLPCSSTCTTNFNYFSSQFWGIKSQAISSLITTGDTHTYTHQSQNVDVENCQNKSLSKEKRFFLVLWLISITQAQIYVEDASCQPESPTNIPYVN